MALSIEEKRQRAYEKKIASMQKARAKQIAKMNDPAEKAKRIEKQRELAIKARQRAIAKLNDPAFKAVQTEKKAKASTKPKKASKGLKGRSPTVFEKKVMNLIGSQPCIACRNKGRENPVISLHHVFGRVDDNAHAFVLPLCAYHHDTLLGVEHRTKYPDMLPLHAKGKFGGKKQFSEHNGTEIELLKQVYELVGLDFSIIPNVH